MIVLALALTLAACGEAPAPPEPVAVREEPTPPPAPDRPSLADAAAAAATRTLDHEANAPEGAPPIGRSTAQPSSYMPPPRPPTEPDANPILAMRKVNLALATGDLESAEALLPEAVSLGADKTALCLARLTIAWMHDGATVADLNAGPPPGAERCR